MSKTDSLEQNDCLRMVPPKSKYFMTPNTVAIFVLFGVVFYMTLTFLNQLTLYLDDFKACFQKNIKTQKKH
jgi:hypothetical protein